MAMNIYILTKHMASDRNDSLYDKVHASIKKHIHKRIAKHVNIVHKHYNRVHKIRYQINHIFLHAGELIIAAAICRSGFMHAGNSGALPNNTSFSYPLQKVSTLECRTQYREDMEEPCKINLPIVKGANYAAYVNNTTYRSIYTTMRAASYSKTWDQEAGAHAGIDIATARGTPIYSIGNGVVYSAGWNSSYGNLVRIKYIHNGKIVYGIFAHMDTIEVEAGQTVTRGQKIGTVGNSGNTTGALGGYHLHFEIDKDNGGRPAYSYTNCADLSLGHYKIIQNGLCRDELFKYQYDPIKVIEGVENPDRPSSLSQKIEEQENTGNIANTGPSNDNENTLNTGNNNTGNPETNISTGHSSPIKDDTENNQNSNKQDKDKTAENNKETNTNNQEKNNETINNNTKSEEVIQGKDDPKTENKIENNENQNDSKIEENSSSENNNQNTNNNTENQNSNEAENTNQNTSNYQAKDPEIIELKFDKLTGMGQHFMTQRDVEMKSKLNTRSLKLGETLTIDIEVFKKGTSENREYCTNGILQVPFEFITNNNNISVNISSLQLLTKGKATIEITGMKEGSSAIVIKLGGEKIGVLNIEVR